MKILNFALIFAMSMGSALNADKKEYAECKAVEVNDENQENNFEDAPHTNTVKDILLNAQRKNRPSSKGFQSCTKALLSLEYAEDANKPLHQIAKEMEEQNFDTRGLNDPAMIKAAISSVLLHTQGLSTCECFSEKIWKGGMWSGNDKDISNQVDPEHKLSIKQLFEIIDNCKKEEENRVTKAIDGFKTIIESDADITESTISELCTQHDDFITTSPENQKKVLKTAKLLRKNPKAKECVFESLKIQSHSFKKETPKELSEQIEQEFQTKCTKTLMALFNAIHESDEPQS